MAITDFFWGGATQSIAGTTFSKWKDKQVMKKKVPRNNTSQSPAQVEQRTKFAAIAELAKLFGPAIRIGFRMAATNMTEQNVFSSKNKAAVSYSNGQAVIDYTVLVVSAGTVGPIEGLDVAYTAASGSLSVDYVDNSNGSDALPSDKLNFVAYDTVTGATYTYARDAVRDDRNATIPDALPVGLTPANIRVYAFFKRANSTSTSPSLSAVAHA